VAANMNDPEDEQREDGVLAAGIVSGVGFAALFDGVVFHQVLQWHHMVSAWHPPDTVENIELNTTADGWFHVAASLIVVAGVGMLWRATARAGRRPRTGVVVGGGLMGAGGFNVGEGIIDHVLLGVHHVREGSSSGTYDVAFLVVSLGVLAAGGAVAQRALGGR
jgi:uncharacterized membrane protein